MRSVKFSSVASSNLLRSAILFLFLECADPEDVKQIPSEQKVKLNLF